MLNLHCISCIKNLYFEKICKFLSSNGYIYAILPISMLLASFLVNNIVTFFSKRKNHKLKQTSLKFTSHIGYGNEIFLFIYYRE